MTDMPDRIRAGIDHHETYWEPLEGDCPDVKYAGLFEYIRLDALPKLLEKAFYATEQVMGFEENKDMSFEELANLLVEAMGGAQAESRGDTSLDAASSTAEPATPIRRDVIARSLDRYDVIPETELTDYGKGARDAIHGVRQDLGLCEEAMGGELETADSSGRLSDAVHSVAEAEANEPVGEAGSIPVTPAPATPCRPETKPQHKRTSTGWYGDNLPDTTTSAGNEPAQAEPPVRTDSVPFGDHLTAVVESKRRMRERQRKIRGLLAERITMISGPENNIDKLAWHLAKGLDDEAT